MFIFSTLTVCMTQSVFLHKIKHDRMHKISQIDALIFNNLHFFLNMCIYFKFMDLILNLCIYFKEYSIIFNSFYASMHEFMHEFMH